MIHVFGGKPRHEVLEEGLQYIDARRKNLITSFRTPWKGFNSVGIDGLEWHSLLTIAARPGSGKTMISSQILRESYLCNPTEEFNILEFQLEMGSKQYASRAFAAHTALDYNKVLSTQHALDEFSYQKMVQMARDSREAWDKGIRWCSINTPLTHKDMRNAVEHYYNQFDKKKLLITIDHSWLIKKAADEKEKINTLYNATETLMSLKNEFPVIIIMLTQLNRNIDDATRKIPNTIANYPTSNDVFGGDALMQGSDMLVALNRPHKFDITSYGPKGYPMGDNDIAMHLLKVRNNGDDNNMLFFRAEFDKQRMVEVQEPTPQYGNGSVVGSRRRLKSIDPS